MIPRTEFSKPPPGRVARILVVSSDAAVLGAFANIKPAQAEVVVAGTPAAARALLARQEFDLIAAGSETAEDLAGACACPVVAIPPHADAAARLQQLADLALVEARTYRALRQSEALKSGILDAAVDAVIAMDHMGKVVEFNAAAETCFGYARERVLGQDMAELIIPPELRQAHRKGLAHYLASAEGPFLGTRIEVPALRSDGSRFDAELTIIRIPGSQPALFTGTVRDITAHRREQALLRLEHAITRALADAKSETEGLLAVIRAMCETHGWECGRYFAADDAAGVLRFGAAWGIDRPSVAEHLGRSREMVYRRGEGLSGTVWQSGEALWVPDVSRDARASGWTRGGPGRPSALHGGAFLFPVVAGGRILGVLSFSRDGTREPEERLLHAVAAIGSQVGQFLQRQQAEAALRVSEERFRQTFETAGSGIAHVDLEGHFLRVNRSLCAILGYPAAELAGKSVKDVSHPEDRDVTDSARERLRRGEADSVRAEKRYVRKDGSTVWVELTVALARDATGTPLYEISVIDDITERKAAEAALRESEARFRALTELGSDWYWEQDAELRFVRTSGATDERAGISARDHPGLRRWELPNTEIVGQSWEEHRALLAARQPFRDLMLRRIDPAGKARYLSVAGEPVFDAQGAFAGYRGVAKDVTPRIAAELDLRRFRAALDASADMVFLVDVRDSTYLDFNETACRMLGYSREEMLGMATDMVRVDRSREGLFQDYRELGAELGKSAVSIGTYRRKDGSTFPVEVTRRLLQTGERVVLVATARDLTERQRAEALKAALARNQERIARLGQSALAGRDPADLANEAVQTVLEALDADAVAYLEPGPGNQAFVTRSLVGVAQGGSFALGAEAQRMLRLALESGKRRAIDGGALVPVRGERQGRGVLYAISRRPDAFGAEQLNFMEAAASILSTSLGRLDSESRLAYLAQFDPLTALPNRALLADRFEQAIAHARRRQGPLAVLFIDLDEFKLVNDTLGHAGGDELLKAVAGRLQASVRPGDTVARISGDEFAVVLADLARPEDAALVAQKVLASLGEPILIDGKEAFVTASIGIAAFPADGGDAEALLVAADAAMYRAKQSGRNSYQFFTAEINQRSRARAQIGGELRRALERGEFALAYQPKYALEPRRLAGAEALLRWNHPQRGVVSPAEFIPVLEESGLIVAAGEWVLERACRDLKEWCSNGWAAGPVAVNLSARQFRQPDLAERVAAIISACGVEPAMIELEVTESQMMHDAEHAVRLLRVLSEQGIRIAIDDFGTGYSSLSYLTRFPLGALKIDRSFVKNMLDRQAGTLVRTIIEMAHALSFKVVAEGVETAQQLDMLRLLRCDYAQGYFLARPMPAAELAKLAAAPA